ncbi:hypothetical protein [Micromonospora sp. NPDC005197]|uniref:hypothetical protein n=1 Tax=Micromonospora sp. NPDC005197 TaxID=3157020 RepID=UPI00339DC6B0
MGTVQHPTPDRGWLKRAQVDASTDQYSVDARAEMMGRLAEGAGGSRLARAVTRAVAGITLAAIAVSIVLGVLNLMV